MKVLKDIRTYERNQKSVSDLWQIFNFEGGNFPNWIFDEQRIARKLNELGFSIGEEDHLYVVLNPNIPENSIEFSKLSFDKATLYADFGVNPQKFNELSQENKEIFIKEMIFAVLQSKTTPENVPLLQKTKQKIEKYGKNIQILYKTKETSQHCIQIFYQINPENKVLSTREKNGAIAIIKYFNKKSNEEKEFRYPLFFYDDIYYLMNVISLKDKTITIKPKTSFRAEIYNKNYTVPIKFDL